MRKAPVFKYSNNGVFPVRYVARTHVKQQQTDPSAEHYNPYMSEITVSRKKSLENLTKGFTTSGVSDATRKKISIACRVLSYASKVRKVRNGRGEYTTHLVKFITLTLPATQIHTDKEITKHVLGTFLDRCRKIGIMSNYVWRAEKQVNGNIHYHLITDTFCSFTLIRNLWFISLRNFGYLQAYSDKFKVMSFAEYSALAFNKKATPSTVSARFARGSRTGWQEPPAVDMQDINDITGVSQYISKYISKSADNSENIVQGRSWGCSKSVSDSVKIFKSDQEFNKFWFEAGRSILKRKQLDFDYFSFVKCPYTSIIAWFSDCKTYANELLSRAYKPCNYWRLSLGLTEDMFNGAT